ncbi:putative butyrophilin-like protein 10 [Pongo pygmaeus]|uniref:putative butyrophilin-like protein 10 n=1 Tax=Pongo pygmaeus TaxID=9600 RepID=UPI0023E15797|nr:putative butyrophilin-like protein 10 [Pongo pygmaeus]
MAVTCNREAFLSICFVTLVFPQLPLASIWKADFDVIGPHAPILAMAGGHVELQCQLFPNISAEDMELRWYRCQPSLAVHVHKRGMDMDGEQKWQYRGRTTFVSDHVARGKATVRIHRVTAFDNGTYCCHFKDGVKFGEAIVQVKAGLGTEPRIQVMDQQDGVRPECTSAGCFPKPWVERRDFRGQARPAVTNLSASATTRLWAVAPSLKLWDRAVEGLSCSISSSLLPERRKVAESHLPATFSRSSQFMAWKAALPLILVAVGLVIAGGICIF